MSTQHKTTNPAVLLKKFLQFVRVGEPFVLRYVPFALGDVTQGLCHSVNESPLITGEGGGKAHLCSGKKEKEILRNFMRLKYESLGHFTLVLFTITNVYIC